MAVPRTGLCFALGFSILAFVRPGAAQTSADPPALNSEQQQQLLDTMRDYAEQYISNLPNFICVQVTRQFRGGKKPNQWHKSDTLTSKLIFTGGREDRTLQLVNDKPVAAGIARWHAPLTTEGEFGILLGSVFAQSSDASFAWRGWEVVRGRRLAVFGYSVDGRHSTLKLSLSDLAQAIIPYEGSIYADPGTGEIWRITESASNIPQEVRTKSISTTIDYEKLPIGGEMYLLPMGASVLVTTDDGKMRNELEFTGYRKFETDSKITYATVDAPGARTDK